MASRSRLSSTWRYLGSILVLLTAAACGGPQALQAPAAPSNVTAVPGPGYITVQWQDNSSNETGFDIYRADTADLTTLQTGTKVGTAPANSTSYVDLDVEIDHEYEYSVVAVNTAGASEPVAAQAGASVPIGVDLMVGTNNRRWSADTNGTILVMYLVFPDEVLADQADLFQVSVTGPPGWNDGAPRTFQCAWNQCNRTSGFAFSSNNGITAVAGEYHLSVTAAGETYTASATLTDPGFKFPRPTDMTVTNVSSAGGTLTWTAPPGTLGHYVLLYRGEYDGLVDSWVFDHTPSLTVDNLTLEDGIYGFEIVPLNADISTYPIKIEQFGLSYDYKMFGVGEIQSPECASPDQTISIPDAVLRQVVRDAIGISTGDITCIDMALLTRIDARDAGIASLEGLQYALNLDDVFMHGNDVSDLGPLAGLTNMWHLNLNLNEVTDVSPLANLTNLTELHVCCSTGNITDVTPLEGLTQLVGLNLTGHHLGDAVVWPLLENYPNLIRLWVGENDLTDFTALANHPNLEGLQASGNVINDMTPIANLGNLVELQLHWAVIADLTPLHSMTQLNMLDVRGLELTDISFLEGFVNLRHLELAFNELTSIAPLVANPGIGSGDYVDVRNNALDLDDPGVQADIQTLLGRGVDLRYQ